MTTKPELLDRVQRAVAAELPEDEHDYTSPWVYEKAIEIAYAAGLLAGQERTKEAEPVAYMSEDGKYCYPIANIVEAKKLGSAAAVAIAETLTVPLYAAPCADDARDAARYRLLRNTIYLPSVFDGTKGYSLKIGERLDEACDAAIDAQRKETP